LNHSKEGEDLMKKTTSPFCSIGMILLLMLSLTLVCVLPATLVHAADGDFVWARGLGGDFDGFGQWSDSGYGIAVDTSGNVYTTGQFREGSGDFDPGTGTYSLTSAGDVDIFVTKLDSSGNIVWARAMGGTGEDIGYSIFVDSSGNVYTTGFFNGTADFDPGTEAGEIFNLTSLGDKDIFISKLDSNGNFVWAKKIGDSGEDIGYGIYVDTFGNVHTTGQFQGTPDFDPGIEAGETYNLSASGADVFISKLDNTGNFVWAKAINGTGTGGADVGYAISVDSSGYVYTTGSFVVGADFDPGSGTHILTGGGVFVSKLDSSGAFVWASTMGGANNGAGRGIAIDIFGNVYTTGWFLDTADFDPGTGAGETFNLTAAAYDIFVSKLDSSGNFVWAKAMGGALSDFGRGIAVDSFSNVYTTGYFRGTGDFDPGPETYNLIDTGVINEDPFISKLDSNGNFVYAKNMGGTAHDNAYGIAVDSVGNSYTTGYYQLYGDFDPGPGTATLTSAGNMDIFVVHLLTTHTVTPSAGLNGSATPADHQTVDHGSTTQFTFDADSTYYVASISGCGITYANTDHNVTSRTETTDAITEACTVSATFASADTYQLSVTTEGKGTGSVTSDLGSINCPGTCSELFIDGTIVTLTAEPEQGSSFAGWSGDCTGTDLTCDVTLDQARDVTAVFYYFPWTMFLPAIVNNALP